MDSDTISESVQVFLERGYFACGPSWPDTFDYTSMQSTHICIVVVLAVNLFTPAFESKH